MIDVLAKQSAMVDIPTEYRDDAGGMYTLTENDKLPSQITAQQQQKEKISIVKSQASKSPLEREAIRTPPCSPPSRSLRDII